MLTRPDYSRFREPDLVDLDYSGIEVTIEVEDEPFRFHRDGPVIALVAGQVELIGHECESYDVRSVWFFDASTGGKVLLGSLEEKLRECLIEAAAREADQRFREELEG
jgi:hypothetical protein